MKATTRGSIPASKALATWCRGGLPLAGGPIEEHLNLFGHLLYGGVGYRNLYLRTP